MHNTHYIIGFFVQCLKLDKFEWFWLEKCRQYFGGVIIFS